MFTELLCATRVNRNTSFFHSSNPTPTVEDVADEYRCVAAPSDDRTALTILQDQTIVLDTGRSGQVYAVAFQPDGEHLLGGTEHGIHRWRLADGQEVGKQMRMTVYAISVSKDHRWIVCGTTKGASVWDRDMGEKVIEVGTLESAAYVWAVDVSPDSTRFATGTTSKASIWSVTSGERLVGPLGQVNSVVGIRFSPTGERIASACAGNYVRIFDSHTGDNLVTIKINIPNRPSTPLAWSTDGQQVFATSSDKKIKSFDASTGSLLDESQILCDGNSDFSAIVLATNGKFIATVATRKSISFLDTATLTRIDPVIKDGEEPYSIAISPDNNYLATSQKDGKIAIRHLRSVLPDLYGPFHVSIVPLSPSMLVKPHPVSLINDLCRYLGGTTTTRLTLNP